MFPVTSQDRILSALDIARIVGQFWGYLTALVSWGCAVETLYDGFAIGAVVLVNCIFLTVLEIYVPIHVHFLRRVVSDESSWFKTVDAMQFKGVNRTKAIIYTCFGLLSCLEPSKVWLAAVSGVFTLVLAAFSGLTLVRRLIAARSSVSPYSRYESALEPGEIRSTEQRA